MTERPLLVIAAIIKKDDKFLITRRPNDNRPNGGRWEFPGGKVDFGETPQLAIKREIFEELGIIVRVDKIFELSSNVYEDINKHVILLAYHCVWESGEISKKDVSDYRLVTPTQMDDFDITEADIPFVKKLQQNE